MKIVFLALLIFFSFQSHAGIGWLALGASTVRFSDVSPNDVQGLEKGQSAFLDADLAPLNVFAIHYGFRITTAEDFNVRFNSQSPREAALRFTKHELGFKFVLPYPRFDIYVGLGGTYGNVKLEDKTSQVKDEERNAFGFYRHIGIHVFLSETVGLKLAYQMDNIRSLEMKNLENDNLKFDQSTVSLGLVFRFTGIDK